MNISNTDETKGFMIPPHFEEFIANELYELCKETGSAITRPVSGKDYFTVPDFEYDEIEAVFLKLLKEIS